MFYLIILQGAQRKKMSPYNQSPVKARPKDVFTNKEDGFSLAGT